MSGMDRLTWARNFEHELIKLRREWVRRIDWDVVMTFLAKGDSPFVAASRYSAMLDSTEDKEDEHLVSETDRRV